MKGHCTIPTDYTLQPLCYRYVIFSKHGKKGQLSTTKDYEFLLYTNCGIINRVLIIPEELQGQTSGQ